MIQVTEHLTTLPSVGVLLSSYAGPHEIDDEPPPRPATGEESEPEEGNEEPTETPESEGSETGEG